MQVFRLVVSWLLALVLIGYLLAVTIYPLPDPPHGFVKFYDLPGDSLVFATLAQTTGFAQFEPLGRLVAGGLELIAAVLLLFPPWRRVGAALALMISLVGVGLHLSPFLGRELFFADGSSDNGQMFLHVVAAAAISLLVLMVHPARDVYS